MTYQADNRRYSEMGYRRCGKSGILLPPLSLGLWQNFGSDAPYERSRGIVLRAFDLGITHFDLANNYGTPYGSAEENFGRIMAQDLHCYRDELIISTKAGHRMWEGPYGEWGSRKYLMASLDQSLKRMGLEYVDIYYSHRPDPDTPLEETMGALASAVKQGKALYVGLSKYSPEQTRQAIDLLSDMGVKCLIYQSRYNMFSREDENEMFTLLQDEGIGFIGFGPLAQGLLSDKYLSGMPKGSRASMKNSTLSSESITPEKIAKLVKLNEIAENRNQTLAQMAIAWTLRAGKATSALVGASSVEQIEENVAGLRNLEFSAGEIRGIEGILETAYDF